jgi:hypothetical protein
MTTIALSHQGFLAVILAIIASAIPLAQRAVLTFMAAKNLTHHAGAWSPSPEERGRWHNYFPLSPGEGGPSAVALAKVDGG